MNRRLGVLISGRGSNLQALIDAIRDGRLDATIAVVISNVRTRRASSARAQAGIEALVHRAIAAGRRATTTIARWSRELQARDVDLVCLAGFMRLVGAPLLEAFPERHPQHPPVAAAGVSRRRRAAPGARARRAR